MHATDKKQVKQHIHSVIAKHPGIYLSKLAEMLQMNIGEIQQIINDLEQENSISVVAIDGYKRYYAQEVKKRSGLRQRRITMTRQKIIDLIENKPGIHMSKIADTLSMRLSLVQYHLQKMEKEQRVIAVTDVGYYKRYYLSGSTSGPRERNLVALLREPIPLQIVVYVLRHPNAKHKDILAQFDVTSATLSYHLNKLVNLEVLEAPLYAEDKGYHISNPGEIINLLKKHRLLPLTQSFEQVWDDLAFK